MPWSQHFQAVETRGDAQTAVYVSGDIELRGAGSEAHKRTKFVLQCKRAINACEEIRQPVSKKLRVVLGEARLGFHTDYRSPIKLALKIRNCVTMTSLSPVPLFGGLSNSEAP